MIAGGLFRGHEVFPVCRFMTVPVFPRRFYLLAHEIRRRGRGEDLQMGMDQGTSRRRHVVPVDDVVNGFRMARCGDAAEEVGGESESGGHVVHGEVRHGDVVPGTECGHGPDAVIRRDVRENHHVVLGQAALGDQFGREARRDSEHLFPAERTPCFGSGNKGVEVRLLPLQLHKMADPCGSSG
ncbi:MAG: hypothetical protein P8X55_21850 [Desulfosarcinaceae bacterium]